MKTKTNMMMSHIVHRMLCKRGFSISIVLAYSYTMENGEKKALFSKISGYVLEIFPTTLQNVASPVTKTGYYTNSRFY